MSSSQPLRVDAVAEEALSLLGDGRQVMPFTARDASFGLAQAYAVAGLVRDRRKARGEKPVGRKIGFTNRSVWDGAGLTGPIWNYMYDRTVRELATFTGAFPLAGWPEPRIEPELALHFARLPSAEMSDEALIDCVDWIAHGFEVVHSVFPGWALKSADGVAACGVHTGFFLGEKRDITRDRARWAMALENFTCELRGSQGVVRQGHARNVMGGPLQSVRGCMEEIARFPGSEPIGAGEIVTTGTLTEAMPIAPGETWTTGIGGIDLPGLKLSFK